MPSRLLSSNMCRDGRQEIGDLLLKESIRMSEDGWIEIPKVAWVLGVELNEEATARRLSGSARWISD